MFADLDLQTLGIFMTRVAVREQKPAPKFAQANNDFEFGDDFQEAGVVSIRRKKTRVQNSINTGSAGFPTGV